MNSVHQYSTAAPDSNPKAHRAGPAFTGWSVVIGLIACSALAGAASLESFVLDVGGLSHLGPGFSCATFGSPAPVTAFFNGGVGIPTDGLTTCGVAGDFEDATAATGPLSRSRSLTSSWTNGSYNGTANCRAEYGYLSADGHSTYAGDQNAFVVVGAEGFARCNDNFTITSPSVANGQSGTVRFVIKISGGLSTTAGGTADVELNYQISGGSIFTMFRAQANDAGTVPGTSSIDDAGSAGFTFVPGSMSGSGQPHTFANSFVFGTPFDFNLGLFAYTIPGNATVDSHFQAYISNIQVTGPQGAVSDFVVTTASGAVYGPTGVVGVDPPGSLAIADAVRLTAAPNPAASGTRLSFVLPYATRARLEIFDASGRLVRLLRDGGTERAGSQAIVWDGRDDRGAPSPGGTYYARLRWNAESRTTRLTLIR